MEKNLEIVERLFSLGLINVENISELRKSAAESGRELLEEAFVSDVISPDALPFILSETFDLAYMALEKNDFDPSLSEAIPFDLAWGERIIPISSSKDQITLGVSIPFKKSIFREVERITGKRVRIVMVKESAIKEMLRHMYHIPVPHVKESYSGVLEGQVDIERFVASMDSRSLVKELLYRSRVSGMDLLVVHHVFGRVVIDGYRKREKIVLLDASQDMGDFIFSGLMKLCSFAEDGSPLVETILELGEGPRAGMYKVTLFCNPGLNKAVIKIIPDALGKFSLETIGMDVEQQRVLGRLLEKEGGLYIVASPSYEGVTTTLYALIRHLQKPESRILAIEDDIRFKNEGFIQIEKGMLKHPLSLTKFVRSFLPHIVMADNISFDALMPELDQLSGAGISLLVGIKADSLEDILQYIMTSGGYSLSLSSYLKVVIFQCLVRELCHVCKKELPAFPYGDMIEELKDYERGQFLKNIKYFLPEGCDECGMTGYDGKSALFDIMTFPPSIRMAVLSGKTGKEKISGSDFHSRKSPHEKIVNMLMEGKVTIEESLPFIRSYVTGEKQPRG